MSMTFRAHIGGDVRIGGDLDTLCHNHSGLPLPYLPITAVIVPGSAGSFSVPPSQMIKAKVAVVPALSWVVESVTHCHDHIRQGTV
jgi:hypothetical protein